MAAIKYDADYSESGVTALLHPQQSTARDTADFFPFCGSSFVFFILYGIGAKVRSHCAALHRDGQRCAGIRNNSALRDTQARA